MENLLNSIQSVALIVLLILAGYVFAAKGWFTEQDKKFVSGYLMKLAIPCVCINSMRAHLTMDMLRDAGPLLLIPALVNTLCFLLSYAAGRLLKLPRESLGVFMMLCGLPNSLFIGYPLCIQLFGEEASPHIMFYYIVCSIFTQLVGLSLIRWAGATENRFLPLLWKMLTSPTVLGVLAGILLVLIDYYPPELIMLFCDYTGQTVTPLALLISGQIIHSIGLKSLSIDRTMLTVLFFRFVLSPAICLALCLAFRMDSFPRSIFTVMSALPVVTQTVVGAAEYHADEKLAAQGVAVSTLASFFVLPLLNVLLK